MATHSNVRAWRIPGMGEPGGLQSMGSTESDTTKTMQQQQQQQQQQVSHSSSSNEQVPFNFMAAQ